MRQGPVVGAGVALIALLLGCAPGAGPVRTQEQRGQIDAAVVRLDLGSSAVTVRSGAVGRIDLLARIRHSVREPEQSWRSDGDALVLHGCGRDCSVDYELVVPSGTSVEGMDGSGEVTLTGVAEVDVETGSGAVEVRDVSGLVTVTTGSGSVLLERLGDRGMVNSSSGSITGRELSGPMDATTTSGDLTLDLARQQNVRAQTSSGDVALTVPAGSYRVDSRPEGGSGESRIDVVNDPDAQYALDLSTSSGTISVRQR